ncbi:hypothetical protein HMPREF3217_01494 [Finegoldia magna]|nr:hypothetical protein HMPREF3217_01494 [Finegoldia magna]
MWLFLVCVKVLRFANKKVICRIKARTTNNFFQHLYIFFL